MTNRIFAAFGLLAVIAASAASAQSQRPSAGTAEAHRLADAAGADRAVRAGVARWIELIKARDADGIAEGVYAADGVLMAPNVPIVSGHDDLRNFWRAMLQIPNLTLTFEPQRIDVSRSGDLAIDRGTYRLTGNPNGQQLDDSGKFIEVWRKTGGEWKVTANIFNSDKPAGK
jgi:ketosteroid isomerase-like protein